MAEEKEHAFEFVDRRRVSAEGTPANPDAAKETSTAADQATAGEQTAGAASGETEAEAGGVPDVDVWGLLASFVGVLHGFAWQKMGFVANPATGQVETDLPQAKVAIDTVQFLVGQLESRMSEREVREMRRMLMDLQMNFMRRSSSGS